MGVASGGRDAGGGVRIIGLKRKRKTSKKNAVGKEITKSPNPKTSEEWGILERRNRGGAVCKHGRKEKRCWCA